MKNITFEKNENNKTGTTCSETGMYVCQLHSYIEKNCQKGSLFPKCDQKGIPHNTTWYKIV